MTNFTTSTPHDALFKTFLTHPDTARDFMEIHLPKGLRELCDLDTLKLESASFVDEKIAGATLRYSVVGKDPRRRWLYLCGD